MGSWILLMNQSKRLSDSEAMQKLKEQHKSRMLAFENIILEHFTLSKPLSETEKRRLFRKIREKAVFFQESIDIFQKIFRPENASRLNKRFET